jgi:hypothetical protein
MFDVNQAYYCMYKAMQDGHYSAARDLALQLKDWIRLGGYLPYQYTRTEIDSYVNSVLRRTAGMA